MALAVTDAGITIDAYDSAAPHTVIAATYTVPMTVAAGDIVLVCAWADVYGGGGPIWNDGNTPDGATYFPSPGLEFKAGAGGQTWSYRVCDGSEGGDIYSWGLSAGSNRAVGLAGWLITTGGATLAGTGSVEDFQTITGLFSSPVTATATGDAETANVIDFWLGRFALNENASPSISSASESGGSLSVPIQATALGFNSGDAFTPYLGAQIISAYRVQGEDASTVWTYTTSDLGNGFSQERWGVMRMRLAFGTAGSSGESDVWAWLG